MHLLLLSSFLTIAQAASPVCSVVSSKCNSPERLARATSYCAAYLGLPSTTTTTTLTITTPPPCGSTRTMGPTFSSSSAPAHLGGRSPLVERSPPVPENEPICLRRHLSKDSACDCLSLPSTLTVTATATATAVGPFYIGEKASGSSEYLGRLKDGRPVLAFHHYYYAADAWVLAPNGSLYDTWDQLFYAYEFENIGGDVPVFISSQLQAQLSNYQPLRCKINAANSCSLDCTVNGNVNNYACYANKEWYLSPNAIDSNQCHQFQPYVWV